MYFNDTSFNLLMQKRIRRILLICSSYDAFMLEEDGRIDEQIFNEYVSLNLKHPPTFIHTDTAQGALNILEHEEIDLVIEMLSVGESDAFDLAKLLKKKNNTIPIVVLTPFSRKVSLLLKNEDLSAIDYVFCWLGNADLLLAIIKMLEDKMNAPFDVSKIGVQVIILVEDSIRYVSTYLPALYKIVLNQSKVFATEALNEHQQMLRMRGRPKILFAKNYKEASILFERYKNNTIGVISDVSYKKTALQRDTESKLGLKFCKKIKDYDSNIPVLLQSSDLNNKPLAHELHAGFIHKYSPDLNIELRDFVTHNFAFGNFEFIDPDTCQVYCTVSDLKSLQEEILKLPGHILKYHAMRDDFSKWLNARALFPVASVLKKAKVNDFNATDELRYFIYQVIADFRSAKARGVIAEFNADKFDEYTLFSRIGNGSIGGKARGIAFIDQVIKKHNLRNKYERVKIRIPRSVVISTDYFDQFMELNQLYSSVLMHSTDEEILQTFVKAKLPADVSMKIETFAGRVNQPVAVRSSSKLEDSYYQPFAGVYKTYMIPMTSSVKTNAQLLEQAIKAVYASVYYSQSINYMAATTNVIDEEKMGIILQEVVGNRKANLFYPPVSGVARSINYYPTGPETPGDGIVNIAYGLGKHIVDGGMSFRFSPAYPKNAMQYSDAQTSLKETQKSFIGLSLNINDFQVSPNDSINLIKLSIKKADNDPDLTYVCSYYDLQDQMIRDYKTEKCTRLVTFSSVLQHQRFPLASVLKNVLALAQREMNRAVEIEFACTIDDTNTIMNLYLLQIRPIVQKAFDGKLNIQVSDIDNNTLLYASKALGNGYYNNIADIIYVRAERFDTLKTQAIVHEIEKINQDFVDSKRHYLLIGPGRWGSSDPFLGIPVKWPQISQAMCIAEVEHNQLKSEPSQGTHFFQNLTSFGIAYITLSAKPPDILNTGLFNKAKNIKNYQYLQHVTFNTSLQIAINGVQGKAIIKYLSKGEQGK